MKTLKKKDPPQNKTQTKEKKNTKLIFPLPLHLCCFIAR
jgi:hypothetical protein